MSPEGFEEILDGFPFDFVPRRGLAKDLHALIFPVRDRYIFTGTETDQVTVQRLYGGMADAFNQSALVVKG
ncbi:Tyrosine-protein kinaseactive site protein [Penicillium lividum]|nr:Tyrosine-protein kinaseactive site protein [Penicillium lividum]